MTERRTWTQEEDKALKYLKDVLKVQKWSEISRRFQDEFHLPARNGKQCRERYTNHLCDSIKFAEITTEEEQRLFKLHDLLGNKWSQICKDFQGRTQNQIKNHFHSKLRKAIRKLNKSIKFYFKSKVQLYKLNIVYKIVEASDFRFFSAIYFQQDLKFFNDLKNMLIEYADGVISQKSFIQRPNGKEKVLLLLSQLERFETSLKKNKKLIAANKKNKKKSNRKVCSNDKMIIQTLNCQLSEIDNEIENQEKEMEEFWQKGLISSEMGFSLNQEDCESACCLRELKESLSLQLTMGEQKIRGKCLDCNREKETGEVQNQKSHMNEEKPILIIPDLIKGITENEEIAEIPIHMEFSRNSFESLIEFDDNHLKDFQVSLMVRKFNSFSDIDATLFE